MSSPSVNDLQTNPEEELEVGDRDHSLEENIVQGLLTPEGEQPIELGANGAESGQPQQYNDSTSPESNYDRDEGVPHKDAKQISKVRFDPTLSQKRRRDMALEWQKKRRDEILEKIRQLETDSGLSDSEPEDIDFAEEVAKKSKKSKFSDKNGDTRAEKTSASNGSGSLYKMDTSQQQQTTGGRKKQYQNQWRSQKKSPPVGVMLSEWLVEKPADFEDEWLGVLCPVGKRALVVACRGKTKVFTRTNQYLGRWSSMLPGGRKASYTVLGNRGRGVTILDCIWSEESQIFYVLDLICWNSHSCGNCDTEYRQFFLMSKFHESPELLTPGPANPIPFMPLPFFKAETLPMIMTSIYPPFPEKIDGVLFFHKEAYYITETNPLCLWILLSDVAARLGVDVNPELLAREKRTKKAENRVVKMRVGMQQ